MGLMLTDDILSSGLVKAVVHKLLSISQRMLILTEVGTKLVTGVIVTGVIGQL